MFKPLPRNTFGEGISGRDRLLNHYETLLATPANSRAEAIGEHAKELLEHFQLAQQRKVYNNLRALLQQEGE